MTAQTTFSGRTNESLPVAVIGAGPVGLAAAAHLVRHGFTPLIIEAGETVGHSIRAWGHVRLFSPWRYDIDAVASQMLDASGWSRPDPDELPTGHDLVDRYLQPLAALPEIREHLHLGLRVVAVGRERLDKVRTAGREARPFIVYAEDEWGVRRPFRVQAVIDASGTWQSPNPMGAGGIEATGEREHASFITYGIPDVLGRERSRYAGRRVLVVGSGHSAANTLLDLARLRREEPATRITWAIRRKGPERTYGGEEADALEARGALGSQLHGLVDQGGLQLLASFTATDVEHRGDGLRVGGFRDDSPFAFDVDEVVVATGFRPDLSFLREVRLALDPALESVAALAPLIDPNEHSCGTVRPHGERELRQPEPGFYVAGMKSYGRAPTFLLATGYEQVRSVVAALAGDREAADRVELDLPETGVCSVDFAVREGEATLGLAAAAGDGGVCCVSPAARPAEPVTAQITSSACCSAPTLRLEREGMPDADSGVAGRTQGNFSRGVCCGS